jgi:hypothetical protein
MKNLMNMALAGLFLVTGASIAGNRTPEPIKTLSPETGSDVELKLSYESFQGMELDESENFDGWTTMAEVSMPFMDRFRLRLTYPFRTEGDADVKDDQPIMPGESIDIEGNGGVFDFLTLQFEHQLKSVEQDGYGFSYYIGGGAVPSRLDTTKQRPNGGFDAFNHTGTVILGGVRMDRQHGFGHGILNLGLRYYGASDDLAPGNNDAFAVADLKGAIMFNPWGPVHPVVELIYLGDFSDMNQLSVIPGLVFPLGRNVDLKAGATIGLAGNGSEFGAQAQAVVKF